MIILKFARNYGSPNSAENVNCFENLDLCLQIISMPTTDFSLITELCLPKYGPKANCKFSNPAILIFVNLPSHLTITFVDVCITSGPIAPGIFPLIPCLLQQLVTWLVYQRQLPPRLDHVTTFPGICPHIEPCFRIREVAPTTSTPHVFSILH